MINLWRDVRYALRTMAKNRGFAAVAIFTLALGIGASTVIFSVVYSVLFHPFPYKNVDRLATFHIHFPSTADENNRFFWSAPELLEFQKENQVFVDMVGIASLYTFYKAEEGTRTLVGGLVTPNAFEILGVAPLLGRPITIDDGRKTSAPVFAMSYAFWTKEFRRDPKVLGTSLVLNGESRTLVAIMPPRFKFYDCDVWIPTNLSEMDRIPGSLGEQGPWFWPVGVLRSGVSVEAAEADLQVVAHRAAKLYPSGYLPGFALKAESFMKYSVGDIRAALFTLIAGVMMLLLIACSNVANLLLSRATARAKEMAIRASVGASPWRLARQLLVESAVLALSGCLLGCFFAYCGIRVGTTAVPSGTFPSEVQIGLNGTSLFFAMGLSLFTTVLCGVAPAVRGLRGGANLSAVCGREGVGGNLRQGMLRAGLVVMEVALSIVLLIGSGLMMRSLVALKSAKLGFDPKNVLYLRVQHPVRYASAVQKNAFFRDALERIKPMPGVISTTEAITVPPFGAGLTSVLVPGKASPDGLTAISELCSEDYFRTLGIPVLRGRVFEQGEVDSARTVVLINQAFARAFFGVKDAIGERIKLPAWEANYSDWPRDASFEVIGIVGDAKNQSLKEPSRAQVYIPYTMTATGLNDDRVLIVKTAGVPESILPTLRRAVLGLDGTVAITESGTIESSLREDYYTQPQFALLLVGAFAGVGLVLVIVGISSMMAYTVSLRTQEIGVRMALGAQQKDVLQMVLRKGLTLVGAGTLIGLSVSLALARLIASQIWGVSSNDAWTYSAAAVLIVGAGLVACLLPARRASRLDPLLALRYE